MAECSPISLPEDYIEFLREISGDTSEENVGVEIRLIVPDDEDSTLSMAFYSAQDALEKYKEYKELSAPLYDKIIDKIWIIGDDIGDLVYFYGNGKDGFGLYVDEIGALTPHSLEDSTGAEKIADTITDLLVKGIGINTALWID